MIKAVRILAGDHPEKFLVPMSAYFFQALLGTAPFLFVYLVVCEVLGAHGAGREIDLALLALSFLGVLACLSAQLFVAIKAGTSVYVTGYELGADLRLRVGAHLKKLPMSFFKRRDLGEVTALLLQDIYKLEMNLTFVYPEVISYMALSAVILLFLFMADWRMSVLILASVMVALPVLAITQKIVRYFGEKQTRSRHEVSSGMLEYLQGIKVLKAYNHAGAQFAGLEKSMGKLWKDSVVLEAIPVPLVTGFVSILETGYVFLLVLGAYLIFGGSLTVPVFVLFMIIGNQVYEPLKRMSIMMPEMRHMDIAADRIGAVLDEKPLPEPACDVVLDRFDVEFRDVSFRYLEDDVLRNVSFTVPEKSVTALVGPSGSGKSTIMNLIPRFWDAGTGAVLVGGTNVKDLKNDRMLSYVSIVFQDVYLFNDTILNNIKIGKPGASLEEVVAAAKASQCHDFITALPRGYDTLVGEGGSTLSGGEKQRISIARAILKDAPIVLLDEATASLDPENEVLIQQAIQELVKSKTLLVIAHKLYTVSKADQILVLDKGEIVERGRHRELLAKKGLYAHFWEEQQKAQGWKFGGRKKVEISPVSTIQSSQT